MKKIIVITIAAIFIVILLNSCEQSIKFKTEVYDNGLIITNCTGHKEDVIIPENIGNKKIIGIGRCAFQWKKSIKTIFIPDSVKSIGEGAFQECTSLISINIPDSVTSIERNTFRGCVSLTSINIPASVKKIGEFAFSGCSSLTEVYLPDSLLEIDLSTYDEWTSHKSMELPLTIKVKYKPLAIKGYVPLNNVSLPIPPGGIAKNPNGKLIFISKFNYDDLPHNNSIEYYLNYDILNEFEKITFPVFSEKYILNNLSEAEYIILVTSKQGKPITYSGESGYKTRYETSAIIDLYKLNASNDTFVKIKNLGIVESGHEGTIFSISGSNNVAYKKVSDKKIADLVISNLDAIKGKNN